MKQPTRFQWAWYEDHTPCDRITSGTAYQSRTAPAMPIGHYLHRDPDLYPPGIPIYRGDYCHWPRQDRTP
jgi:hypothetical protein